MLDIGKTGRGGHVEAGARIAAAVLDRMGIPEPSRGLAAEDPADVERFLGSMPRTYLLAVPPEAAAGHFRLVRSALGALEVRTAAGPGARPGTHALAVVARDRPGLLSRIAGTLALSGL